jgi:predicted NBD/HSP70 family sugar kinase
MATTNPLPSTSENSRRQVVSALDQARGPMTRAEIMKTANLSRPTVGSVLEVLTKHGVVRSSLAEKPKHGLGSPGHPVQTFELTKAAGVVLAIDVGHGGVRVALGDPGGAFLARPRGQPLDPKGKLLRHGERFDVDLLGPAVLRHAAEQARHLMRVGDVKARDIRGVGIGMPAPILSDMNRVAAATYMPGWGGINIAERVVEELERAIPSGGWSQERVFVENDANAAALGQLGRGAARGKRDLFYVKVSSGVGAGVIVNGEIYRGRSLAGEFGHTAIPASVLSLPPLPGDSEALVPAPQRCPRCSKPDCLEMYASGDALMRMLAARSSTYAEKDAKTVVTRVKESPAVDPLANAALGRVGHVLGHALGHAVALLDPEVIIVGGVLAEAGARLLDPINESLDALGIGPHRARVELVQERSNAGLHGAIAVALAHTEPMGFTKLKRVGRGT